MEATPDSIRLISPASPWVLGHIRTLVSSVAWQMGFSEDAIHQIELSVDEACTNAMQHGYDDCAAQDSAISVCLHPLPDGLRIDIIDHGCGSHSGQPHSGTSSIEEYIALERPEGLGTYIMHRFMDQVVFSFPPPQGTVVTLVKHIGAPAAAPQQAPRAQ